MRFLGQSRPIQQFIQRPAKETKKYLDNSISSYTVHMLKDEGKAIGSRFKNTLYFFRSGSGSLVTVTDQRVDSRKRQSQPYATIRTAISYLSRLRSAFLSTAFSYSILTLDSTRLDKRLAPSPAARSLDA